MKLRTEVKTARFLSAEHMVRTVVAGASTMLGALAEQGDDALDAIVAVVTEAARGLVDGGGWATPVVSHIVTAAA